MTPHLTRTPEERIVELLAANIRFEQEARDARAAKLKAEAVAEVALDALAAAQAPKGTPVGRIITNRSRAEEDFEKERRVVALNYSASYDDKQTKGELARAALVHVLDHVDGIDLIVKRDLVSAVEPWPTSHLQRRKALLVAASYLVSEVERMDRRERRDAPLIDAEIAAMDPRCAERLGLEGKPRPRTCAVCGLGPCLERRRKAVNG